MHRADLYLREQFREWWSNRVAVVNKDRLIQRLKAGRFEVSPFLRFDGRLVASLRVHLRLNRAALNERAFKWKRVASPACRCGALIESNVHVVLDCPLHTRPRSLLLNALQARGLDRADLLAVALGELPLRFLVRSSDKSPYRATSEGRALLAAGAAFLLAVHSARPLL